MPRPASWNVWLASLCWTPAGPLPPGRGSVQAAESTERRASASGRRGLGLSPGPVAAIAGLLLCLPLHPADRWELQYFYDENDSTLTFTDLQFPSERHGVAAGIVVERERRRRPVVLLTVDGGGKWELIPVRQPPLSLFFLNAQTGWMVTTEGNLWKTSDGGRTWTRLRLSGVRADPVRVFFLDEAHGWLLGVRKQVYVTADGGASWESVAASSSPDAPEARSLYTEIVFDGRNGLLAGWSRAAGRASGLPPWMEPDLTPIGKPPTTALLLRTSDGGRTWSPHTLPAFGEILRARLLDGSSAVVLVRRPDALSVPTGLFRLDLNTLHTASLYASRDRWLTDLALAGPQRAFAAAIDQEGRTPFPAIPGKLRVLTSADFQQWSEMEVDYRAEGRHAMLAAPGPAHAWLATDTGMILRWVKE
jgi:photosystem II stability/assembly factor-like uncharacterized protein